MTLTIPRFFKRSYSFRFLYWLFVLNWVDLLSTVKRVPRRHSAKKRVVFVRVDGIGDYVIWTTVFDRLRQIYPESEYERILVGNERWRELAEGEPTFQEQLFVDHDRFVLSVGYRMSILKQVRQLRPDVVVNPRLSRDFLWGDSIVRASGADVRIGSAGIDNLLSPMQERLSRRWYTQVIDPPEPGEHQLISNCKFLDVYENECLPTLASVSLRSRSPRVQGDYAIFFIGAFSRDRCWPAERFAQAANYVSEKYGLQTVVCAGHGEQRVGEEFRTLFKGEFIDLIGATTLLELSGLIRSAKLIVSNDTGAAHIAALSGRPTVVIAPYNEPGKYFPYPPTVGAMQVRQSTVHHSGPACARCRPACVKISSSDQVRPCIDHISADDVTTAIRKLMETEV